MVLEQTKLEQIFKKEDEEKEQMAEINKKLKESMKIEKRKIIEQRLQEKEKQRKLKYKEMKEMQSRSRSVMNKKPLYEIMQKNYESTIMKEEIEVRMK